MVDCNVFTAKPDRAEKDRTTRCGSEAGGNAQLCQITSHVFCAPLMVRARDHHLTCSVRRRGAVIVARLAQ